MTFLDQYQLPLADGLVVAGLIAALFVVGLFAVMGGE